MKAEDNADRYVLDQAVDTDDLIRMEHEERKHGSALRAT